MTILKCLKFLFLGFAVFSIQSISISQEKVPMVLDNSYSENLILNTDRELYIAGEKIWFKANCFDNETDAETILSKIIYLELYDYKTKTVTKGKFRIINGVASGFLSIPENLISGNYYLRAYTQFLRNYSSYLYPSSLISIINPEKPDTREEISYNDVLIVPEGTKLIKGIPSKLAIRINKELNRRLRKAVILDNNKKELLSFMPYSNGLSLVEFKPESSEQYFLKLILNDSSFIIKQLPPITKNGMVLHSNYINSKLKISLISNTAPINSENIDYKIEIRSQNYKKLLIREIKQNGLIEIQENQLTSGIVYIVLKNKNDEIINISSKFIPKGQTKKIEIKKNKPVFKPRELVELDINLPQNYSHKNGYVITVTKTGTVNSSKNTLPSYLTYNPVFLSNYLKNSDFTSDSLKEQINIALILYSNIYNSVGFKEEFQQNNVIKFFPEMRDVSLKGQVIDKNTKKPLKNVMVYASVFGGNKQFHIYKTKANGEFIFSLNHLTKKQNVFVCIKPKDSLQTEILIHNDFSNKYPQTELIPLYLDTSRLDLLEQLYLNYQVSNTFNYHTDKIEEKHSYSSLLVEDQLVSISLKDFIKIPVIKEVFNEIIPFVTTRKKGDQYYLKVFDSKKKVYYEPIVLVDGVPVFDMNEVMKITPELVDKIDVINRKYYLGDYTLPGVIRISTKTNNFAGISFPKEAVFIEYETVTPQTYPLFPDYIATTTKNRIPDFRNLLYWNPNIFLNNKRGKIKFYSSDHCGSYEVVVNGHDKDNQYHGKIHIQIEKSTD